MKYKGVRSGLTKLNYCLPLDWFIFIQQCDSFPCSRSGQYFILFPHNFFFQFHPNNSTLFFFYLIMCTDGRFGRKVIEGASWWCAGHRLPLSVPRLAHAFSDRFRTWSDFCLRNAQHSFTPCKSARERGVWLDFPLFSFHYTQTRMEPYFYITLW